MTQKKKPHKDFPGSSVAETSPSNEEGTGLIPGWGAKIPHTSGPKHQNIQQKQYYKNSIKTLKMVHLKKKKPSISDKIGSASQVLCRRWTRVRGPAEDLMGEQMNAEWVTWGRKPRTGWGRPQLLLLCSHLFSIVGLKKDLETKSPWWFLRVQSGGSRRNPLPNLSRTNCCCTDC